MKLNKGQERYMCDMCKVEFWHTAECAAPNFSSGISDLFLVYDLCTECARKVRDFIEAGDSLGDE